MLSVFTVLFLCSIGWSYVTTDVVSRPTVGIIRWDAWNKVNGKYDEISFYSHRAMTPEHYHYRLPFFAKVNEDKNVTYNADMQEVMDQEILYAKFAGLDYWAFDTYCSFGPNCSSNSPYCIQYYQQTSTRYCPENPSYGLHRYLSSQYVSLLNFTFILLGSSPCGDEYQEQYLELMTHPQFHTVLGGRPLIYLFQFDDQEAQACAGGWEGSAKVFSNFRQKVINRGLQNPYLVLMDTDVKTVKAHADALGFDAISTYAIMGGTLQGSPFSDQVQQTKQWWNDALQSGSKFVPIVSTGWDPRPRAENPVPWTDEGPQHFLQPTAEELQSVVNSSFELTCSNKTAVDAQTILVYAWNESSENGATIIPSLGNGTYYVRALAEILPKTC